MRKRNRKDERWWAFSAGGWRRVGFVSLGVLVGLGAVMSNPMTRINVWATIGSTTEGGSLPSGAQVDLNAYDEIQSEVTLTMDASSENGKLNASVAETNPDAAADVVKRTATVGLTNTSGYTVKIRGNSTNLTGASTSNTIPSVTTATTLGQMSNAWGWNGSIGDVVTDCSLAGTFKQMTTNDQELGSGGAESSATKKVTMCFGARVDGTKAADTYFNTVTLSVVAQPGKVATFDGITQMQQMTPTICKAADINDTAQLEDVRDGKKYWVTKLLDGNCWMSQNLALDITINASNVSNVLKVDSDVISNWVYDDDDWYAASPRATTSDVTVGDTTNSGTYSWNLGDYVLISPTTTSDCGSNNIGLSACAAQFVAVGSRSPSTDPNFYKNNGAKTYTDTEYDAHYLAGNYYQWTTATAGSGMLVPANEGSRAGESICPKGWKLPNMNGVTGNGSFRYVLRQYGLASEDGNGTLTGVSDANENTYHFALSPLFFVRSGTISKYNSNAFGNAGSSGGYWSSVAGSDSRKASAMSLSADSINPSVATERYTGRSLRCLVPTS